MREHPEQRLPVILQRSQLAELDNAQLLERRRLLEQLACSNSPSAEPSAVRAPDEIVGRGSPEWLEAYEQISGLLELRYVQARALPHLAPAVLQQMDTRGLLRRLGALRRCCECLECSDFIPAAVREVDGILFKGSEEWQIACKAVKDVLATREHVSRGSREKRQIRGRESFTSRRRGS